MRRIRNRLARWAFVIGAAWLFDPTQGRARRERLMRWSRDSAQRLQHVVRRRPAEAPGDATSLVDIETRYERRGQPLVQHVVTEHADVMCGACGVMAPPETVGRPWRHRLEGASDPGDMATASGVTCPRCGALGMLVLRNGPEASAVDAEVLRRLPPPETDDIDEALRSTATLASRMHESIGRGRLLIGAKR
jgi:hypothetical protein